MIRLDVNRCAKILFDAGLAASIEEAEKKLSLLTLVVEITPEAAATRKGQVAFLTAVNCAVRCFKGGVFMHGSLDTRLVVPWSYVATIRQAALELGAQNGVAPDEAIAIAIGNGASEHRVGVRAFANGFAGGAVPIDEDTKIDDGGFIPGAVLAGALCVSEAFLKRTMQRVACERSIGCDLIKPKSDW